MLTLSQWTPVWGDYCGLCLHLIVNAKQHSNCVQTKSRAKLRPLVFASAWKDNVSLTRWFTDLVIRNYVEWSLHRFCTKCESRYVTTVCLLQAQTEIQAMMEENTYPLFLKSDLYLEYTRTGGESPKPNPSDQSPSSGPAKPVPGYLPTLAEDEEWRWEEL